MADFAHESWYELYRNAVLELKHAKMTGRIADARAGITARLEILKQLPGLHEEEQESIGDALNTLRVLEREEARFQAEEVKSIAERALEKLEFVAPKIQELDNPSAD